MSHPLDLPIAHEIIAADAILLRGEAVSINEALNRVAKSFLSAKVPQPGYDQSGRDGYAIAADGDAVETGRRFQVIGEEAPAGSIKKIILFEGTACRIMTGGMIPAGGVRVVPQEDCMVEGGKVTVPAHALQRKNTFIQKKGEQIAEADLLAEAGTVLQPEHLALLAATGHTKIEVYRKPRVGFFCSGSELVGSPEQLVPGLKISTNRYLLGGLIRQFLAEGEDLGIVKDVQNDLHRAFDQLKSASFDIVISTGGMGPGKYDLLEEAFCLAGGEVHFRSLNMRPGKSALFGRFGDILFFGLPGPPGAVRTLMNEMVGPALLRLQGVKDCGPVAMQARLEQRVDMKNNDVLHLKAGILSFASGFACVRLAGRLEIATCFILFPPGRSVYQPSSEVEVHLAYSPFASQIFAVA